MLVAIYQRYDVLFDAFHIHRREILTFSIYVLGNCNFIVPFLLYLMLSLVFSEARSHGLLVLGYLSVKFSVHPNFTIVFPHFHHCNHCKFRWSQISNWPVIGIFVSTNYFNNCYDFI